MGSAANMQESLNAYSKHIFPPEISLFCQRGSVVEAQRNETG